MAACVGALLAWGVVDHFRNRFAAATDREIIGWHLLPDFLLLPVRLAFSIWGNLAAIRLLDARELDAARELLGVIRQKRRVPLSSLTLVEPDTRRLFKLVSALQLLDLIDLHRGEDGWFYTIRSTHDDELRKLLSGAAHEH